MCGARSVVVPLVLAFLVHAAPVARGAQAPPTSSFTADQLAAAEERRLLGVSRYDAARYPESRELLQSALATFVELGQRRGAALTRRALGSTLLMIGERAEAEAHYRQALDDFRALGDRTEEARTLISLSYATEEDEMPHTALAIARELGNRVLEARALHVIGDDRFNAGNYDGALAALQESAALYESEGEKGDLARVLTSLGRVHRAHGRPAQALGFYERALVFQNDVGDEQGVIQSLNALAVTYGLLGRQAESLEHYERALARARKTGSRAVLTFLLANTGSAYVAAGRRETGIAMLREAIATLPDAQNAMYWHGNLADALLAQGQLAEARTQAERSVALARARGNAQHLPTALSRLARVRQRQGDAGGALADLRDALQGIEALRRTLVPTDFMKRGFGDTYRAVYDLTIELLAGAGRAAEAFDAAEQARARAFLDLLAASGSPEFVPIPGVAATDPGLRSASTTTPASTQEMIATAERLRSTIVGYWVSAEETIIWVISPAGVHVARSPVSAARLRTLVKATADVEGGATRGAATRVQRPRIASPREGPWRELYRLLIAPVAEHLPSQSGARLTIIPHDALLGLSFAALQDPRGLYLIERYAIHYVPAGGLLRFTADRDRMLAAASPRYVLVANPSPMPRVSERLQPLPAAAQEARAIARMAAPAPVVTLTGPAATEPAVRAALGNGSVLHFATHALVRDTDPMDSFLALAASNASDPSSDGRLTARELYDVRLEARLVVLSACRTAGGEMSGDGILGLSRALFFAGASSILATTWEVGDESSRRLMERFYTRWPGGTRGDALREAQLALIRDLREGRVTVATPAGRATLPEHPYFWAGFVLLGEF